MAFAATSHSLPPDVDTRQRYSFTLADYHKLIESGHLTREDRLELIRGELIIMPPIGPEHSFHTTRITNLLPLRLPPGLLLRMNEPISIPHHSEPQPDAAVVRSRTDGYRTGHPLPEDVLLIIEVADSSARFDTQVKAKLYGVAGIPEYWVIDVPQACLRVFIDPTSRGYKTTQVFEREDTVKCRSIPELVLPVEELLR